MYEYKRGKKTLKGQLFGLFHWESGAEMENVRGKRGRKGTRGRGEEEKQGGVANAPSTTGTLLPPLPSPLSFHCMSATKKYLGLDLSLSLAICYIFSNLL